MVGFGEDQVIFATCLTESLASLQSKDVSEDDGAQGAHVETLDCSRPAVIVVIVSTHRVTMRKQIDVLISVRVDEGEVEMAVVN